MADLRPQGSLVRGALCPAGPTWEVMYSSMKAAEEIGFGLGVQWHFCVPLSAAGCDHPALGIPW